jgi:chemotaxis protein MotB
LSSQLEKQLSGIPGVTIEEGKVSLTGEVFFDSGKATIKKTAEESLKKVAQALKQSGVVFRIDGHTDSQPIVRSGWKSNHDLAAARALAVFHFFGEEGIGEERMYVAAYGPNKPKTSNETAEGRKQNRRVEMLLLSGVAAATPPPGGAAPKAPKAKKPAGEEAPAPKKPKT